MQLLSSLCYDYSFVYNLLFIYPEATIGVFGVTIHKYFEKIVAMKTLQNFSPKKTSILESLIQTHLQAFKRPGVQKTTRLERFMSVLDVQKKACLRSFRHVQRCAHEITCFIWQSLNYLCSLFGSDIYVLLNEKWQIYKSPIRSAM